MTILEEDHHSFLIVEHDPLLYEDAGEMVEYLAQALRQTSREATILLYAPALDPHLQKLTELADRVFCIYSEQAPAKVRGRRGRWRRTLEVALEPQAAMKILSEVFGTRPGVAEQLKLSNHINVYLHIIIT